MNEELYTPSQVANFILNKAESEHYPITQLKLLKLVYLLYGWSLAVLERRLFDEQIQAWKLGPVIPSLYHEFKRFGQNPITEKSIYMDPDTGTSCNPIIDANNEVIPIIQKAWDVYKPFTAYALVTKTHEVDSPWLKHYNSKKKDVVIPDSDIKEYFVRKIGEYIAAST